MAIQEDISDGNPDNVKGEEPQLDAESCFKILKSIIEGYVGEDGSLAGEEQGGEDLDIYERKKMILARREREKRHKDIAKT